jgi:hypothetical protein
LEKIQSFHVHKSGSFSGNDMNTLNILTSYPIIRQSRTAFGEEAKRRLYECCSLVSERHTLRQSVSDWLRADGYGFVVGMEREFCLLRLVQTD